MCSESELLPFMSSPPNTNNTTPQQHRISGGGGINPCAPPQPRPPFSLRKMSCNGCRVLRKGCSENCILRQCLQWIETPQSQANATVFVAKFFGRAGLMAFIAAVQERERPALFKSLLYEACGRTVSPVHGAIGLLWTGNWHLCQAAVEKVLNGGTLERNKFPSFDPNEKPNFASAEVHERSSFPSAEAYERSSFPSVVDADDRAHFPLIDANGLEILTNGERPSPLPDIDFDVDIHSRTSIPDICVEMPPGKRFSGDDVCRIYEIDARVSCAAPENAQRRRVRQRTDDEGRAVNGDVDNGGVTVAVAVNDDGKNVEDGNVMGEGNVDDVAPDGEENQQQTQRQNHNNTEGEIKLDLSLNNCQAKSKSSNLKQQRVSSPSANSVTSEGSVNRTKAPASPTSQKLLDLL